MTILGSIDREEYFKIDALSQSDLGQMAISPRHFLHKDKLRKETDAMKMGTLLHLAVLEPAKFRQTYVVEPDNIKGEAINRRVKAHREYLEAFRLDNLDRIVVTAQQMDNLVGMLESIASNEFLKPLLTGGSPEIAATWDYKGLKCKGLADYVVDHKLFGRTIVDIKKTQDASVSGFSRSIFNYRYNLQCAWYLHGFEAREFIFVAIEDKAPYAIGIYKADPSLVEHGQKLMERLTEKLIWCRENDEWPGYTRGIENILLPAWVAGQDDEKVA